MKRFHSMKLSFLLIFLIMGSVIFTVNAADYGKDDLGGYIIYRGTKYYYDNLEFEKRVTIKKEHIIFGDLWLHFEMRSKSTIDGGATWSKWREFAVPRVCPPGYSKYNMQQELEAVDEEFVFDVINGKQVLLHRYANYDLAKSPNRMMFWWEGDSLHFYQSVFCLYSDLRRLNK
ncbi:hypothetical protein FACS1894190_12100 [Spirochaetia bacterium]|nr:hypothetical protein FACS1894190_12100 [Spirochaetia bacterium]